MGSGTSRGKKVAPACVGEVNVSKSYDDTVRSLRRENHSVKPLKTPNNANSTNSRNHAQQDCHSEGHDSEFSAEDDELDAELDRVLEDYEDKDRFSTRKKTPKKSFIRSKTYGFCNFRRVHSDNDFNSTPQLPTTELSEEPRGQDEGSVEVNSKRGNGVFGHFRKHTPPCHSNQQNGLFARGPCVEPVPRPEKDSSLGSCHGPSLAMPVIQYDGSEEELMDTIEREFS